MSENTPITPWLSQGSAVKVYPCDRGTGTPVGYHHFEWSHAIAICRFCGARTAR